VKAIYTEDVIKAIRLRLKKNCGMSFTQDDVAEAVQEVILGAQEGAGRPRVLR